MSCIAILAQPEVPLAAGFIGFLKQFVISTLLRNFPRSGGDRDHHLNLRKSCGRRTDPAGKLAVLALLGKKDEMIVACYIGSNRPINERFQWSTLQPRSFVARAFNQDRFGIVRNLHDISAQRFESARIDRPISFVAGFEGDRTRVSLVRQKGGGCAREQRPACQV